MIHTQYTVHDTTRNFYVISNTVWYRGWEYFDWWTLPLCLFVFSMLKTVDSFFCIRVFVSRYDLLLSLSTR